MGSRSEEREQSNQRESKCQISIGCLLIILPYPGLMYGLFLNSVSVPVINSKVGEDVTEMPLLSLPAQCCSDISASSGKDSASYQVQYTQSVGVCPNPAFPYPLLGRELLEEIHFPVLCEILSGRIEEALLASAANLPNRLRSDPDSVAYNQLVLRFLLPGTFYFLRGTRLVLSSLEVPLQIPLW